MERHGSVHAGDTAAARLWWVPLVLALLAAGGLLTRHTVREADQAIRDELLADALRVGQAISTDRVMALTGTEADLEDPNYLRFKDQLAALKHVDDRYRFIYLLGRRPDGQIFFFVDNEPLGSEDESPAGQIYDEVPEAFLRVFRTSRAETEGPYTDRWGTFVAAAVPLTDFATGEMIAVLGVDIDAGDWRRSIFHAALTPSLLTLAMITILLVGQGLSARRRRLTEAAPGWMRHFEPALLAAAGLALTLFAASTADRNERDSRHKRFTQLGAGRTLAIADGMRNLRDAELESLARFFEGSNFVDPEEFAHFTHFLARDPMVQGWGWVPAVPDTERARFEAEARANGFPGFEIWEMDEQGNRVRASGRDVHYPVLYLAPTTGNEGALGYDLGSEPLRRAAIEAARRTGLVTATDPISLLQDSARGMVVFRPVFYNGSPDHQQGFVVSVIQMRRLLAGAGMGVSDTPMEMALLHPDGLRESLAATDCADQPGYALSMTRPVLAFGKTFLLTSSAEPEFLRLYRARDGRLALLTGLILTAALTVTLSLLIRRRSALEGLVAERTRKLRESQEHLSATLRSIGDGVIACDAEGSVVSLNAVAERLTGWSSTDAEGRPIGDVFNIIDSKTRGKSHNPAVRALREGTIVSLSNHTALIARDGAEHQIADSCAPIRDDAGAVIGAVLVFRDVTNEYRQREELAEERRRIDYILGVTGTGIDIVDAEFNLRYVDPAWQKVYGDPSGRKCHEYFMGLDHPCPTCRIPKALETREKVISEEVLPLEGNRVIEVHAIPFQERSGEWLVAEFNVDVTERKKSEEALREKETLLRETQRVARLGGWKANPQTDYLEWTNGVYDIIEESRDYRPGFAEGVKYYCAEYLPAFQEGLVKCLASGEPFNLEAELITAKGNRRWVEVRGFARTDTDGEHVVMGTIQDITERRMVEDALRESERRARLQRSAIAELMFSEELMGSEMTRSLERVCEVMSRTIGTSRSSVWELSPDGLELRCLMLYEADRKTHSNGAVLSSSIFPEYFDAIKADGSISAEDAPNDPRTHGIATGYLEPSGISSLLDVGITIDGKMVGVVSCEHTGDKRHWHSDEESFMGAVAASVAQILVESRRRQAEEALQESESKYRRLADSMSDMIWTTDLEFNTTYISPSVERMLGYTPQEYLSVPLENNYPPQFIDRFASMLRDEMLKEEDPGSDMDRAMLVEAPHYRADGGIVWLSMSVTFARDRDGQAIGLQGISRDITERHHAEQALRASETRMRAITSSAQDAIAMMSPDGEISFWNPAAERIFGYSAEEAIGRDLHSLLTPERYRESQRNAYATFRETGCGAAVNKSLELEGRNKDGHEISVELSMSAIELSDGWHAVGIMRDITDRKRTEETLREANAALEQQTCVATEMAARAEAASVAKGEFLANMSHEIRTPMNGVIGMTGLLLDTELNEEQKRYAEVVRTSGEALLSLINDILDFSKIEAGKLELETLDFDLYSMLDDFSVTLALRAHEKGLELLCGADPGVPSLLRGDPGRLRQILTNLTGNAIKFTYEGEVAIHVSLETETDSEVELRFSVRDTGIGIPEEKIGLLFQKFFQADASTTRKFGGTGLGLAISAQLAGLLGGRMGVSSEQGKGSDFWFTAKLEKQQEVSVSEPALPVDLNGMRVLIVDDNATSREILSTRMTAWGMRPGEAVDGGEALNLLLRAAEGGDPYRLAVIDMKMPGMDGEALGRAIQAEPRIAGTRMVLLTSMGARGDARRYSGIGFAGYLTKPVRHQDLRGVLSLAMGERKPEESAVAALATRHLARETMPVFTGRRARILLVEDNIINQRVALRFLKKLGLSADAVADGQEALRALESIPYDIVLMDCQMPIMDGYEATRAIRDPRSSRWDPDIPVIALTAHAMQGDKEKCLAAGMNDYLTKPISQQQLAEAIEKWLPGGERGDEGGEPEADTEAA